MITSILPYVTVFVGGLLLTLALTPLIRELNRRFGMVDLPNARRINTVPVPRGGGLAIVIGVSFAFGLYLHLVHPSGVIGLPVQVFYKLAVLSWIIAAIGLIDDRFSLPAKVKLAGQIIVAFLVWWWADLGFSDLWPGLPCWLDCILTILWITGAVNAFNLIDGLDGLASGIALIATIGMAGGLFFRHNTDLIFFYLAFAGGLLGFLRYNYHPASVFLGDCGSMYIGFVLSTLPLASHVPNSFLVSVGVPLLAMGVPIFDAALAILRRSLRHVILGRQNAQGHVMTADADHLHHRLLRKVGLSQRKAAWILYGLAAGGVAIGLIAVTLETRAGGLWLASVAIAAIVIFKDATVELFDAGILLNRMAHARGDAAHRRAVWAIPFYVIFDILALIAAYFICSHFLGLTQDVHAIRTALLVRVSLTFFCLILFNVYRTVWSRAVVSNYLRLFMACVLGAILGSVFSYYWPTIDHSRLNLFTFAVAVLSSFFLIAMRLARGVIRDLFYAIDCARILTKKETSRILVYGAGLRYKSFRRELIRTASENNRVIVGLLDDDAYLKGRYIGGIKIYGTINDAPQIIKDLHIDAVVIACVVSDEWLRAVKEILAPTGVKITKFSFSESDV